MKTARTFPAPAVVGGGTYTVDELEVLSSGDTPLSLWAARIFRHERDNILASVRPATELPKALFQEDEYGYTFVAGLLYGSDVYTSHGWKDGMLACAACDVSANDAAFIVRAFHEGIDSVYLRPVIPVARIDLTTGLTAAGETPQVEDNLPEGAVAVAVVDELDKTAVLDLIAIAPGPVVFRRHDGEWGKDDVWIHALKSIKPPPLVKVEDDLLTRVIAQIDEATAGEPFSKEEELEDEAVEPGLTASLCLEIEQAELNYIVASALIAAKSGASIAKKAGSAEQLRQYWLRGEGAAKIRWGTKGDWTRCYKHLSKYLGPRAKGYCQLMHGRATGTWAGKNQSKAPNPAVAAEAVAKQLSK